MFFQNFFQNFMRKGHDFVNHTKTLHCTKFQFDREFEGHRFVSRMTVMCYPCKNKVDLFYFIYFILFIYLFIYLFNMYYKVMQNIVK